jgi:hypothetical protein
VKRETANVKGFATFEIATSLIGNRETANVKLESRIRMTQNNWHANKSAICNEFMAAQDLFSV